MSDINLQWLVDNFSDRPVVFFDIGCADITGDAGTFKALIPNAVVYAFECSEQWKEHNKEWAPKLGVHYYHVALADHSDGVTFYPSEKNNGDEDWPWSGSIHAPSEYLQSVGLQFGTGYTVPSVTLNGFCEEHDLVPDFIHIDAQGAEHTIFRNMTVRPAAIWAEISEFHTYESGTTYEQFNQMMLDYGYIQAHLDNHDALYIHSSFNCTGYRPN